MKQGIKLIFVVWPRTAFLIFLHLTILNNHHLLGWPVCKLYLSQFTNTQAHTPPHCLYSQCVNHWKFQRSKFPGWQADHPLDSYLVTDFPHHPHFHKCFQETLVFSSLVWIFFCCLKCVAPSIKSPHIVTSPGSSSKGHALLCERKIVCFYLGGVCMFSEAL